MTGPAALNVWRVLQLELGDRVARELSLENDATSRAAMRRMQIALRVFCSLRRAS